MRVRPIAALLLAASAVAACSGGGGATPPLATLGPLPTGSPPGSGGATTIGPFSPPASASAPASLPASGNLSAPPASALPTLAPVTAAPPTPSHPVSTRKPTPSPNTSSLPTTPFHLAADLEGRLPTSVSGKPLTVESVRADGFKDANGAHQLGLRCRWYINRGLRCRDQKELADAVAAVGKAPGDVTIAVAYNETPDQEVEVQATRVAGADANALRDAVLKILGDDASKGGGQLNAAAGTVGGKNVVVITYSSPYPLGLRRWLYASGDTLFDVRRAYDNEATEILQALP